MKKNYMELDTHKKFLVTGAAGFIGFFLTKRLLESGTRVIGVDNLNNYYSPALKKQRLEVLLQYPNFQFFHLDIFNKDDLEGVFLSYRPEIVVNLAAQAGVRYSIDHPQSYINSNLIGFYNILECCRNYPVFHLLYASSSSVYGANQKIPYSVEDKTDKPVSLYAATKKSNELLAYAYSNLYGISCTGLRFFTVYGPMGRPDMAYYSFAENIMQGQPIKVFNHGEMYRDFTYIDDIIEALIRMLNNPPEADENGTFYKVYNIGNHHPEKLLHFIECLENALGKKAQIELYPMQPGDVLQTCADVKELIEDFNYKPNTGIQDGLNRFAEWFLRKC